MADRLFLSKEADELISSLHYEINLKSAVGFRKSPFDAILFRLRIIGLRLGSIPDLLLVE